MSPEAVPVASLPGDFIARCFKKSCCSDVGSISLRQACDDCSELTSQPDLPQSCFFIAESLHELRQVVPGFRLIAARQHHPQNAVPSTRKRISSDTDTHRQTDRHRAVPATPILGTGAPLRLRMGLKKSGEALLQRRHDLRVEVVANTTRGPGLRSTQNLARRRAFSSTVHIFTFVPTSLGVCACARACACTLALESSI